jgi:hypothetical protein
MSLMWKRETNNVFGLHYEVVYRLLTTYFNFLFSLCNEMS